MEPESQDPKTAASAGADVPAGVATERVEAREFRGRDAALAAAAVAVSALLVFALLASRTAGSDAIALSAEEAADTTATADDAGPVRASWSADTAAVWTAGRRRTVAFEVRAERPVSVWMRTVHPVLVVRCVAGELEAFVFTDSAAKMEADTPDHAVTLRFDDGETATEWWPDADAHDALFAPDGAAFVRRLSSARRLMFGFSPHNAAPASAEFPVAGLAQVMAGAPPCAAPR